MSNLYRSEKKTGINGRGEPVFCVFVMKGTDVVFVHRFDNEAEADHWIEWA